MKCPECGYEHNEALCPICGARGTRLGSRRDKNDLEYGYHLREADSARTSSAQAAPRPQRSEGEVRGGQRPSYDTSRTKNRSARVVLFVACVIGFLVFLSNVIATIDDITQDIFTPSPDLSFSESACAEASPARPSGPDLLIPDGSGSWYEAGEYEVGVDLEPGEYVIFADAGYCTVRLYDDPSNLSDSRIVTDSFDTHTYLTVEEGQYLDVDGGRFTEEEELDAFEPQGGTLPAGKYKVGKDLQPGEYEIEATDPCYIEIASSSSGILEDILANENIDRGEQRTAVLEPGDYLTVRRGIIHMP